MPRSGTQYDKVEQYTEWIDRVLYVAIAVVVVTFVVRRIRRVRAERAERRSTERRSRSRTRSDRSRPRTPSCDVRERLTGHFFVRADSLWAALLPDFSDSMIQYGSSSVGLKS